MTAIKIYIERAEDRDIVVAVLARNGYTVRQGKEKVGTSNRYMHYVEYWR